jgi:hypothetical protein
MITWLLIVIWLASLVGVWLLAKKHASRPKPLSALELRAVELVRINEQVRDVSGEWKRHQVLATLIDEFPRRRQRELSRAIEKALEWIS